MRCSVTHVIDGVVDPLDLLQEAACERALVSDGAVRRRDEAAGLRDGARAGPKAAGKEVAETAVGANVAEFGLRKVDGEEFHVEPDEEDCAGKTIVRSPKH